jgi:hypothetical protein
VSSEGLGGLRFTVRCSPFEVPTEFGPLLLPARGRGRFPNCPPETAAPEMRPAAFGEGPSIIYNSSMRSTYSVSEAQAQLPMLLKSRKRPDCHYPAG